MLGWSRRRQRDDELLRLRAAIAAAEGAERAAQEAARSTAEALELIRGLQEHRLESTPRRYRTLLVVCAMLILAIVGCAYLLAPAFRDPSPIVTSPGLLQVVVETPRTERNGDFRRLTDAIVVTSEQGEDGERIFFTIAFPEGLEGRQFKLLIAGSAVMKDLDSPETPVTTEEGTCDDPEVIPGYYSEDLDCQVASGTVASRFKYPLQECSDDIRPAYDGDYLHVLVHGIAAAGGRIDWAHPVTNVPDLQGVLGNEPVQEWGGFEFENSMSTTVPTSCHVLELSPSQQDHAASDPPTSESPSKLLWGPTFGGEGAFGVVSTDRSAPAWGNLLLALLGVFVAILSGFVPATYEAWRAWRRHVRRQPQSLLE